MRIDTIQLDVVLKEEPVYRNTVTKHPVERGAKATDHSQRELLSLTVEAIISDLGPQGPAGVAAAEEFFRDLHDNPRPIFVELSRGPYPQLQMEEWAPVITPQIGGALQFRVHFTEWNEKNVHRARVQRVGVQVKKGPAQIETIEPTARQSLAYTGVFGKSVQNGTADQWSRQGGANVGSASVHQGVP